MLKLKLLHMKVHFSSPMMAGVFAFTVLLTLSSRAQSPAPRKPGQTSPGQQAQQTQPQKPGQTPSGQQTQPVQQTLQTPAPTPNPAPVKVTKAYPQEQDKAAKPAIGLGDQVVLEVRGISTLLAKANPKSGPKQDIKLFIDKRQVDGLNLIISEPRGDSAMMIFQLVRTADNDKVWGQLLGKPEYPYFFDRPAVFSVGLDKGYAEDSGADNRLVRVRPAGFWICLLVVAGYFVLLIYCGKTTPMLRDSVVDLAPLNLPTPGGLAPYSLGRLQMAFWFSLVVVCFFFIWLITGNYELITPGILGLVGISSGTALSAASIDSGKTQDTITQIKTLQQQEADLLSRIAALGALNPPGPTTAADIGFARSQQQQISKSIQQLLKSLTLRSESFRKDLLTDVNGYSFHRLQMATWTIVLGIVFVYSVWAGLTMPDFSVTQLTLMGITASTYVGFKFPEKQS